MGGAASAQAQLEQMVACTFLLGQALSRAFPDIYTLNDFHANRELLDRKMLKQQEQSSKAIPMVFLGPDGSVTPIQFVDKDGNPIKEDAQIKDKETQDEQDDNETEQEVPLDQCLVVRLHEQDIPLRLDSIHEQNQDGWTALHAACHQQAAAEAAKQIIQLYKENGYDLNMKTKRGPGSYASGWTPLHMACAYGITDTVRELLDAGADVHVHNSIGWTPLFDAIHRGYTEIVRMLLHHGVECNQIIPACMIAPYHPQYPLAHAARQGHLGIVKALLDARANKNAQNEGGWSALHEAVFFRQEEIVKTLLVYGCDLSLKTSQGFSVLDFQSTPAITQAIREVCPPDILREHEQKKRASFEREGKTVDVVDREKPEPEISLPCDDLDDREDESESKKKEKPVYRLLGDLPDFKANSFMHSMTNAPTGEESDSDEDVKERRKRIEKRQRMRKKKEKVQLKSVAPAESGVPGEYACQLTGKLLVDPVTTIYGNHFERNAVLAWIRSQGNLCPVTGQPLSESDCIVDKDLRIEISDWQLKQALSNSSDKKPSLGGAPTSTAASAAEDDLYDF